MQEKKLISKGIHASPLIDVRLNLDDIEGAVQVFENVAKEEKVLPAKFSLMDKLIQVSNLTVGKVFWLSTKFAVTNLIWFLNRNDDILLYLGVRRQNCQNLKIENTNLMKRINNFSLTTNNILTVIFSRCIWSYPEACHQFSNENALEQAFQTQITSRAFKALKLPKGPEKHLKMH